MGSLINFNERCEKIKYLKKLNGSTMFVETGCFRGNSLSYALAEFDFNHLFSCDVDIEMVNLCRSKFDSSKVTIYHNNSIDYLNVLLPILSDEESIVFYLDAHLPEHDKNNGNVIMDSDLNFPLEEEIEIISKHRSGKKDVIICDDLRIYEDGPFEGGNWAERNRFGLDLSFLDKYNYQVSKFYNQEGYLLLTV